MSKSDEQMSETDEEKSDSSVLAFSIGAVFVLCGIGFDIKNAVELYTNDAILEGHMNGTNEQINGTSSDVAGESTCHSLLEICKKLTLAFVILKAVGSFTEQNCRVSRNCYRKKFICILFHFFEILYWNI